MTNPRVVLVTGGTGYIGRHLLQQAHGLTLHATWHNHPPDATSSSRGDINKQATAGVAPVGWHQLDVCDADAVTNLVESIRPSVIIHTAYQFNTPDMERVIVDGTRHVAAAALAIGARLICLSTDVVFDGRRGAYREVDETNPLHAYGRAKALTEHEVSRFLPDAAIIRTSLVYGFDPPDPRTLWTVDTARHRGAITLFTDEFRSPIYVVDLAAAILELVELNFAGLIHIAGSEAVSRYEFGVLLCQAYGVDATVIQAAPAASSGLIRPLDCTLDISLARQHLHTPLRGVRQVLHDLKFL